MQTHEAASYVVSMNKTRDWRFGKIGVFAARNLVNAPEQKDFCETREQGLPTISE